MKLTIDTTTKMVTEEIAGEERVFSLYTPDAFSALSQPWLESGWVQGYTYTFTWMGRPVIQLPEDMIRTQEVIYRVRPDVIIETGIAHGGSLIFYASLCKVMGSGRVIGIDLEIRPHNRRAIEGHELFEYITLIEGSSTDSQVVATVKALVEPRETVLIMLDSNHTKQHVLDELNAYASLVSIGSYIVATDGIMKDLVGVPGAQSDWGWNNPYEAVQEFLRHHPEFILEQPCPPFDESNGLTNNITYWPGAWLRRKA